MPHDFLMACTNFHEHRMLPRLGMLGNKTAGMLKAGIQLLHALDGDSFGRSWDMNERGEDPTLALVLHVQQREERLHSHRVSDDHVSVGLAAA